MALKPPPFSDVIQQVNDLLGPRGFKQEVDRNLRALAQAALGRLDVVSREEFDAQTAILKRTKSKVAALESELASLTAELEALESPGKDSA